MVWWQLNFSSASVLHFSRWPTVFWGIISFRLQRHTKRKYAASQAQSFSITFCQSRLSCLWGFGLPTHTKSRTYRSSPNCACPNPLASHNILLEFLYLLHAAHGLALLWSTPPNAVPHLLLCRLSQNLSTVHEGVLPSTCFNSAVATSQGDKI